MTKYNEKRTVIHVTGAPAREAASLGPTFSYTQQRAILKIHKSKFPEALNKVAHRSREAVLEEWQSLVVSKIFYYSAEGKERKMFRERNLSPPLRRFYS